MVREEGGGVRGAVLFPVSRRREKPPIRPTGEVRPAPGSRAQAHAGNQAREPRRRRQAPARTRYARIRVPSQRQAGGGRTERSGTKRDNRATCGAEMNAASAGLACCCTSSSPACGRGWVRARFRPGGSGGRSPGNARHAESPPSRPPPQAGEGMTRNKRRREKEEGWPHAPNDHSIYAALMQIMTSHDTP